MHASMIGVTRPKPKGRPGKAPKRNIFEEVNAAAQGRIEALVRGWVANARMSGDNLLALNPTRADKKVGSFCINVRSGIWADFATNDKGGDIISYYAYIKGLSQIDAAKELADRLGVSHD
jgi:DNA primase